MIKPPWKEDTELAMRDPQPGDRFTEIYSFWVYVIGRDGDEITYMEASPPCTLPRDGAVKTSTLREFQDHFAYGGNTPGYWITFVDSNNDVSGWKEAERAE